MKLPKTPARLTPAFAFSYVERAFFECLARRQFGPAEQSAAIGFFGGPPAECVYCGSHEVERWDHLIAVRAGGETVLGNMVPACRRCDDSKQHQPFRDWMRGSSRHCPAARGVADIDDRIARIEQYVVQYGYELRNLDDRLTDTERTELAALRTSLLDARRRADSLIQAFQDRVSRATKSD